MPNKFDEENSASITTKSTKSSVGTSYRLICRAENAVVETPRNLRDFFAVKNESNANTLKVTIQKKALSSAATTENEVAIANAT